MAYGIIKVDNITFDNGGSDQNVTVSGLYRATTSGVTVSGTIAATTVSGVTIIGSTTVSGATVTGTTANFTSGNFSNIISSAATMSGALIMANQQQVRFREAVGNGVNHIALQAPAVVSADQTITLPDQTGTVVTTGDNGSVTSTMILDGTILNVDINASAGIVDTKLATIATAGKVSNSATTATNANTASAIVARDASGNFTAGTITAALTGAASSNVLKAGDTMTGVLAVTAGTAALPGLAIASDPNTGIYSPGADQLAISTNGTGRLFVDASGNVGVGTSSPGTALEVVGTARFGDGTNGTVSLTSNSSTSFYDSLNNAATGWQTAAFRATTLTFLTDASSTPTERARIDSLGRVGIGTSSPAVKLDLANIHGINNTVARPFALRNFGQISAAGYGVGMSFFYPNGTTSDLGFEAAAIDSSYISGGNSGNLIFSTNNNTGVAERMRIGNDGTITFNFTGGVYEAVTFSHTATYSNGTLQIQPVTVPGSGLANFYTHFANKVGAGTTNHNVVIGGSLSKGSGSFRIPHPLKPETHELVHSFIEGPQADLIYRGHIQLVDGVATVNIDEAGRMTEGTFEALCTNVCCFTSNESDWTPVRGSVFGNILTIEAQDPTSTADVCWMVIGERKDPHMIETDWTDENGRVITEPLKNQAQ